MEALTILKIKESISMLKLKGVQFNEGMKAKRKKNVKYYTFERKVFPSFPGLYSGRNYPLEG